MDKENHNSGSREVQYLLGRFRDRDLERQFQLEIRPQDRAYAIRVLVLISLVFVSFLPIELVELQTRSALIAVVLGRLGFVLWGALLIYALLHFRDKLQAEMAILLFVIGFGIASIVVYVTQDYLDPHGEGFMMATITYMIATLASYALFPARLSYQAAYAACLMGAYIFNAFMTPPDPSFHLSIIAMFFVATNAVGLVLSGRIHELRRTQWLALNQVRQRADDLKHEIEQREVLETRLREQANTDPLTGIFNRRNFFNLGTELFLQAQRYGRPLSAILFDVDHFKHINDSYGHDAGDEVLKSVVGAISGVLRRPDVFCRYGGEEFAVLLPEADAVGASRLAERIRSVVEERTIRINRKDEHVTISVGVAVYTERDREFGDLITRADDALYSAKHKGRNTVVVSV